MGINTLAGFGTTFVKNGDDFALAAGQAWMIPAGNFMIQTGLYSSIQWYDPLTQLWRTLRDSTSAIRLIASDGANFRVVNFSGCPAGAMITNRGSGYLAPPTVVEATTSGGSKWAAILGGTVSLTQTISPSLGLNYTYPPKVVIDPPAVTPVFGTPNAIQATAIATLSGGKVNGITITNQGAGYPSTQTVYARFITDERDPNGLTPPSGVYSATPVTPAAPFAVNMNASDTAKIAAIVCIDPGNAVTSLPTLTITAVNGGSSGAATVLMNWSVTGYTITTAGTFHAGTIITTSTGKITTATTPSLTNPDFEIGITNPRRAWIQPALATGIVASATTAPLAVDDWGAGFQIIPTLVPIDGTGLSGGVAGALAATVGGQTDFISVQRI